MKKILVGLLILFLTPMAHAASRGQLTNVWASWANVTNSSTTTMTFPFPSRDLHIINGDATNKVCVNLKGGAINAGGCRDNVSTGNYNTVLLGASQSLDLYDYVTSSITMSGAGAAASPVSVIINY